MDRQPNVSPDVDRDRRLHKRLARIEKLLLALNLALPDRPDQLIRTGPARRVILDEILGEIYPKSPEQD